MLDRLKGKHNWGRGEDNKDSDGDRTKKTAGPNVPSGSGYQDHVGASQQQHRGYASATGTYDKRVKVCTRNIVKVQRSDVKTG